MAGAKPEKLEERHEKHAKNRKEIDKFPKKKDLNFYGLKIEPLENCRSSQDQILATPWVLLPSILKTIILFIFNDIQGCLSIHLAFAHF